MPPTIGSPTRFDSGFAQVMFFVSAGAKRSVKERQRYILVEREQI